MYMYILYIYVSVYSSKHTTQTAIIHVYAHVLFRKSYLSYKLCHLKLRYGEG